MHKNVQNLTGQAFGDLVVLRQAASIARKAHWTCRCVCGAECTVRGAHLIAGRIRSCGCTRGASITAAKTRHGATGSPAHRVWSGMLQRCTNPANKRYPRYGGRGISVCERWMVFEHFLADMGQPPPGLTLERIDNDGPYAPGNCRWATRAEQAQNRHHAGIQHRDALGRVAAAPAAGEGGEP